MDGDISCVTNITISLHRIESKESDGVTTTVTFTSLFATTGGSTEVIPADRTNHLLTGLAYNTAYSVTVTARGKAAYQSQQFGSINFTIVAQGKNGSYLSHDS